MKDLLKKYKKSLIAALFALFAAIGVFAVNGDVSQFTKVIEAFTSNEVTNSAQVLEDALKESE